MAGAYDHDGFCIGEDDPVGVISSESSGSDSEYSPSDGEGAGAGAGAAGRRSSARINRKRTAVAGGAVTFTAQKRPRNDRTLERYFDDLVVRWPVGAVVWGSRTAPTVDKLCEFMTMVREYYSREGKARIAKRFADQLYEYSDRLLNETAELIMQISRVQTFINTVLTNCLPQLTRVYQYALTETYNCLAAHVRELTAMEKHFKSGRKAEKNITAIANLVCHCRTTRNTRTIAECLEFAEKFRNKKRKLLALREFLVIHDDPILDKIADLIADQKLDEDLASEMTRALMVTVETQRTLHNRSFMSFEDEIDAVKFSLSHGRARIERDLRENPNSIYNVPIIVIRRAMIMEFHRALDREIPRGSDRLVECEGSGRLIAPFDITDSALDLELLFHGARNAVLDKYKRPAPQAAAGPDHYGTIDDMNTNGCASCHLLAPGVQGTVACATCMRRSSDGTFMHNQVCMDAIARFAGDTNRCFRCLDHGCFACSADLTSMERLASGAITICRNCNTWGCADCMEQLQGDNCPVCRAVNFKN